MLFEKSLRVAEGWQHWKCFSTLVTLVWVRGAHYQEGSKRSGRHWKKLNKQWMEKEHTCHIVVHLGLHHWSFQLLTLYKSSSFTVLNRSHPGETVGKEFCFPIWEWSYKGQPLVAMTDVATTCTKVIVRDRVCLMKTCIWVVKTSFITTHNGPFRTTCRPSDCPRNL